MQRAVGLSETADPPPPLTVQVPLLLHKASVSLFKVERRESTVACRDTSLKTGKGQRVSLPA